MPKTKLCRNCGYTPGESLLVFAFGFGAQVSTSTPDTCSPEHTATELLESATALGARYIANTAAAPANATNRAVRDCTPAITRSDYRRGLCGV